MKDDGLKDLKERTKAFALDIISPLSLGSVS
jgi:hypothetical protein